MGRTVALVTDLIQNNCTREEIGERASLYNNNV